MFCGAEIKKYIINNGVKQKYLASQINISERAMSDIVNEKSGCSINTYIKICKVLDVPFDTFIKNTG